MLWSEAKMDTKNITVQKGTGNIASTGYPIIAVHQLYIGVLQEQPESGPGNAIFIPQWLFQKAGLKYGEKITLTRENCQERCVEAERNRTVTAVFPWPNETAAAVGPTAKFLEKEGPSCFIAYSHGKLENHVAVDLNFPYGNTANDVKDLRVRLDYGQTRVLGISDPIYKVLQEADREVLIASISGLQVEVGDTFCNPMLAQVPRDVIAAAGLPPGNIEAYFSNSSRPLPALKSYLAPGPDSQVAMSGALFGAFPVGDRFVVNIYGTVKGTDEVTPTLVRVN
jgi:hypothetical protein